MHQVGSLRFALLVTWLIGMPLTAEAVHLRGAVRQVGYPGSRTDAFSSGAHHWRPGEWTPIRIELTNDDADRFLGWIEMRQTDRDGDEVLARRQVSVEGTRSFWLCIPAGTAPDTFHIRVHEEDGRLAPLYDNSGNRLDCLRPLMAIDSVPREAWTLLDISSHPLTQLDVATRDIEFVREWVVLRSAPDAIPDQLAGLMMVDTIVWDRADPSVMDIAQLNALIAWTRMGGRLVLGVERTWELVTRSRLAPLLPGRLDGTASFSEPPPWLEQFLGIGMFDAARDRLDPPLLYSPLTRPDLTADAEILVPADDPDEPLASDAHLLVVRRPFGRGEVVLVTASLADLLSHGRRNGPMLHELFETRYASQRDAMHRHRWRPQTDLFGAVQAGTGFGVTAGAYLLIAFLFVVAYVGLNVGGSWIWLDRKKATRYAWIAFAGVALVGSAVSLTAVKWIRGWTYSVEEVSIVDGHAGQAEAVTTSFFGLKAPTHTRIDLRLPADERDPEHLTGDAPLLAPFPANPQWSVSRFAASEHYEAAATIGELRSVPTRATLRQFEARWAGTIDGQLEASLQRVHEGTSELTAHSWIENKLGIDLTDCYLLVAGRNVAPDRRHRHLGISVYAVGHLANGQRVTWADLALRAGSGSPTLRPTMLGQVLEHDWLGDFVRLSRRSEVRYDAAPVSAERGHLTRALLALTFFDEIDIPTLIGDNHELIRSYGQCLDRSNALTRGRAMLVGFSDRPGPARLHLRPADRPTGSWRPLTPERAATMYRILIPIEAAP